LKQTRRESLSYDPVELKFGTSGRRGLVKDLSQMEVFLNVRAEMDFLLKLPPAEGGIKPADSVYLAYDLRPSSTQFMAEEGGRGELLQAAVAAVEAAGLRAVNLGDIPTPALAAYALDRGCASIMITGSHIPFDRNGYKLNTSVGELLKVHETPIAEETTRTREAIYSEDAALSPFNEQGMFRDGHREPPAMNDAAAAEYIERFRSVFGDDALHGYTLLFYQHSSVGRDLLPTLLERMGAKVVRKGRSEVFVPIDTESLGADQLSLMQQLATEAIAEGERIDAVVSADGDADRPLLLAVADGTVHFDSTVHFIAGDLLGMLAAEFLEPDAVVVPISCNDAIDQSPLKPVLLPKTRIGSPFVIAGMQDAIAAGSKRVCGWEANGGFLLGTDFFIEGRRLPKLPTRDSMLPVLAVLLLAKKLGLSLQQTAERLPKRMGATALLKNFPRSQGLALVQRLSGTEETRDSVLPMIRAVIAPSVLPDVASVNYTDGVRVNASNGDVVHLRPSGNADEFRIYAVADSTERANDIAAAGAALVRNQGSR
jgi:phosphomannomutase